MSVDLRRSRSLSQDLRPRVSFNRDVHVKRYGGDKKPLSRIEEEEGVQEKVNSMRGRRGKADGTDYNHSRNNIEDIDSNSGIIGPASNQPNMNTPLTRKHKENHQTFGQRLRSLFGGGTSSNGKKKQNVSTNTAAPSTTDTTDTLRSRYKEYRGQQHETKRKEASTPDNRTNWFRSLDRQSKHRTQQQHGVNTANWSDATAHSKYGGSTRTLRYFGESDTEAMRRPPLTKFSGGTLRRNHRLLIDSTSQDETTDVDTNGRSDSVLYLHTATVGRIPSGNSDRSSSRRSEEHEHRRKRTGRTVVRSVSVASPWRPTHPNNTIIHYSSTDRLNNKNNNTTHVTNNGGHRERSTEKYGHLVFTGPSFDEQLKNDAYRNDRRRF